MKRIICFSIVLLWAAFSFAQATFQGELKMKDGRVLKGNITEYSGFSWGSGYYTVESSGASVTVSATDVERVSDFSRPAAAPAAPTPTRGASGAPRTASSALENPSTYTSLGIVFGNTAGLSIFHVRDNFAVDVDLIASRFSVFDDLNAMFGGAQVNFMGLTSNSKQARFMYGGGFTGGFAYVGVNGIAGVVTNFKKRIELQLDCRIGYAFDWLGWDNSICDWSFNLSVRGRLGKR